jgi:hypothetical protein
VAKKGKKFTQRSIHCILGNNFYCGLVCYGDIVSKGNHTPAVSEEIFDEVQELIPDPRLSSKKIKS